MDLCVICSGVDYDFELYYTIVRPEIYGNSAMIVDENKNLITFEIPNESCMACGDKKCVIMLKTKPRHTLLFSAKIKLPYGVIATGVADTARFEFRTITNFGQVIIERTGEFILFIPGSTISKFSTSVKSFLINGETLALCYVNDSNEVCVITIDGITVAVQKAYLSGTDDEYALYNTGTMSFHIEPHGENGYITIIGD